MFLESICGYLMECWCAVDECFRMVRVRNESFEYMHLKYDVLLYKI